MSESHATRACPICPRNGCASCEPIRVDHILQSIGTDWPLRSFDAGAELYGPDRPCPSYFIIADGWVALSTASDDGARQIVDFALPGGLLGIHPNLEGLAHHGAICLTNVKVLALPRARFDAAMAGDATLMDHVLHISACQTARAYDHIQNITQRPSRGRIAHLLIDLFFRTKHRFPAEPGDAIELPLTLTHIGDALGLTSVHVSRTLTELHASGILQLSRHRLVALAPKAWMNMAGYGPAHAMQPA